MAVNCCDFSDRILCARETGLGLALGGGGGGGLPVLNDPFDCRLVTLGDLGGGEGRLTSDVRLFDRNGAGLLPRATPLAFVDVDVASGCGDDGLGGFVSHSGGLGARLGLP